MKGVFVSATGTDAGKTFVSSVIIATYKSSHQSVVALKPVETGCSSDPNGRLLPADAISLDHASGIETSFDPRFFRAEPPVAPLAAELMGAGKVPAVASLADVLRSYQDRFDRVLVEGAGGLMVPLGGQETILDLACEVGLPLVVVAPNRLGVLSDTLSALTVAQTRGLRVACVVLNRDPLDSSAITNADVLRRFVEAPVIEVGDAPNPSDVPFSIGQAIVAAIEAANSPSS